MGSRHQIWLIGKVVPRDSTDKKAYYRLLGGFHNQWCYGRLPPRAVRRFIDLTKQKDNAEIIQAELDGVQNKYSRNGRDMPVYPCPYTQYLLGTACCVDLDAIPTYATGHSINGYLLPARGDSFGQGPDDGISVIDITDLMNPAYCHILTGKPIVAEEYIRVYFPAPEPGATLKDEDIEVEKDIAAVVATLDDVRLVTMEMLAEVWPAEYPPNDSDSDVSDEVSDDADPSDAVPDESTVEVDNVIPQLADLVIGPAVKQSIAQGNFDGLEPFVWVPEKARAIKSALRDINPFPDAAIPLLRRIYEAQTNKNELDLTGLPLSSDQIIDFVSQHSDIQRLKLSNMPHVTIDTVRKLLASAPSISHLTLLGTTIENDSILELLEEEPKLFYNMEALVHPALLRFSSAAPYKPAFSFPGLLLPFLVGGSCPSLPFFTPQRIVNMFSDFIMGMSWKGMGVSRPGLYIGMMSGSSMLALACLASDRAEGQKWSERQVPIYPLFSKGYLVGEGWTLALSEDSYAFCRHLDAEGENMEVLDLDGFLSAMEAEGRPAALPASVAKLKELIAEVQIKDMNLEGAKLTSNILARNAQSYAATFQR
ncbi:hypothetical protein EYR36_006224 [Pleurotus pulmonarius]|nr:hypothetical protein EYR36_006224 [Pleurotus pulmonarius]KAF4600931.1 hypothetical protein EYR38_005577 [Pleurotus pulmonarius]